MSTRLKLFLSTITVVLVILVAPIVWSAFRADGYFEAGRCTCGNDIYIHITGDSYLTYSPGHGVPEHCSFALRRKEKEWEILALAPPDGYTSPMKEGEVVGRLRFQNRDLYFSGVHTTNWTRHERVYNVWDIWIAQLLKE